MSTVPISGPKHESLDGTPTSSFLRCIMVDKIFTALVFSFTAFLIIQENVGEVVHIRTVKDANAAL